MKFRQNIALAALLVSLAGDAKGQKAARDLTEASLEDLMNIEVTTVSKREQKLSQTPAAVFVITQEDIRRSGMTSVPDLLRMVPGMQVGQIQGGPWAVTARGFNDQYANKLLVLVDGRSVYSPVNAGVAWEQLDTLLEDIERIEVIRGPGATLWGANAVNGVINIITKAAKDTQGALATTGVGDQEQSLGGFRYGGQLGDRGNYRAFVKYLHGRALENLAGQSNIGGESSVSGGFRADWSLSARDSLNVEAGALRAQANSEVFSSSLQPPFQIVKQGVENNQSSDLMASWTHSQSANSRTTLRVYADHAFTSEPNFSRSYSNIDLDFQHQLRLSESNELVWGLGFRDSIIRSSGTFNTSLAVPRRNDQLYSGFIQDQFTLAQGRVSFILGTKLEHNNFTGVEIQPSARLLWTPDPRHTFWAAVSQADRTPSAREDSLVVNLTSAGPNGTPTLIHITGNRAFRSEDLVAYEAGYRLQAKRRVSVDLSTFYNKYNHLQTLDPGAPFLERDPQPAHLLIPVLFANSMRGETYGVEIASNWNASGRWRLIPSYSWMRVDLRLDPTSRDTTSLAEERDAPRHQFQLRSDLDISRRLQFDSAVYYVSSLPGLALPGYARVDARLGYRPRNDMDISFAAQNLQRGRHTEYVSISPYTRATIGRSFFVKLTWGF